MTAPASHSTLSLCSSYWTTLSLDTLRSTIDSQALSMYDEEERALRARKQLSEQTKALKQLSSEQKLTTLPTVMKAYQEEINQLTRRSKHAENAFLALYKSLVEAPDPAPALQFAMVTANACRPLCSILLLYCMIVRMALLLMHIVYVVCACLFAVLIA